jgi:hypothetical protein
MENTMELHASSREIEQGIPLDDQRPPEPREEPEGICHTPRYTVSLTLHKDHKST